MGKFFSSIGILPIIIVVILLLIIWFISIYNKLIKLKVKVDEGFSTMDVFLTKRYDLIPNLVETVKGYATHEKETFEKVVKARNIAMNAVDTEQAIEGNNMLSGALKSLFAVAESYPELKANQNFMDLQQKLSDIENDIANSRKYYNAVVRDFNVAIAVFPNNIVASMSGYKAKPMYEVNSEEQRENVKVKF